MSTQKTIWTIDPAHSETSFKVKHMMISTIRGSFNEFSATAETDGDNFENASFSAEINIDSINTKNTDRDNHLKSDDFFNAEAYPVMTFKSREINENEFIGDLTIRNTTKEVRLAADFNGIAVDPYGQTKAGFELSGEINRKDFGLSWSAVTEAGNIVVSDKIKLQIDAQFIKQ